MAEQKEWVFKKITLTDMMDYIEENAPKDKSAFKENAFVDGKYQHLKAVRWFCSRYMPELIPTKKAKAVKRLENW